VLENSKLSTWIGVNSVLMLLHLSVVGDVVEVSEVHAASTSESTLKMEAACTSETPATLPTVSRYKNLGT
jgi:hypothetical protein